MNETIQIIYLISASIGVLAMIPQIRKLIKVKQSDGLSLTSWGVWACCQMVSFVYALSIDAKAYMMVHVVWMCFHLTMVFLIIKYRKRRSLVDTLLYWKQKGKDKNFHLSFRANAPIVSQSAAEKV